MKCQIIRVISSPSSSTTGLATLIFAIADLCERRKPWTGLGGKRGGTRSNGRAPRGRRYSTGSGGVKAELSGTWLFPRREHRYTCGGGEYDGRLGHRQDQELGRDRRPGGDSGRAAARRQCRRG